MCIRGVTHRRGCAEDPTPHPAAGPPSSGFNPEHGALLCYVHHPYVDENKIVMTRTGDGGWNFHHPHGTHLGTGRHNHHPGLLTLAPFPGNGGPTRTDPTRLL